MTVTVQVQRASKKKGEGLKKKKIDSIGACTLQRAFICAHWCILKRLGVRRSGSCFFGGAVRQDIFLLLRYYNDQAMAL